MAIDRKEFFDLIQHAAKNMGGLCTIEEKTACKNTAVTKITVSGLTKAGDHKGGVFSMGARYDFGKGSELTVLRRLFGADRKLWDSCLPGSQKDKSVTTQIKEASNVACARKSRPSNAEIKELMSNHRPAPNYKGWAATVEAG